MKTTVSLKYFVSDWSQKITRDYNELQIISGDYHSIHDDYRGNGTRESNRKY